MSRPRIRYIKPEIWLSRDFQALSPVGRLTFVALISNADDEGRLKTDPAHLANTYLPGCSTDEIASQLEAMEARRMAITYHVRQVSYVALIGWGTHQRVSHSTPSDLPPPPKFRRRSDNTSQLVLGVSANDGKTRKKSAADSTNKREFEAESLRSAPEDSGSRARLRTSSTSPATVSSTSPANEHNEPSADADLQSLVVATPRAPEPTVQVFEAWRERWHPTAQFTQQRKAKIQSRIREGYSVEDLILAVTDGAAADPWDERHVALNDDLTHLLRDGGAVEKFLGFARNPAGAAPRKLHPFDRYALETMGGR